MKKIGLFGGAFDPPTTGHLKLANYLINKKYLDEVWLMPCYISYYDKKMVDGEIRLKMCQSAINDFGNNKIKVCDFEIKNQIVEETDKVIKSLKKEFENDGITFIFIIGMDNANKIKTWTNYEIIINNMPVYVVPRDGYFPIEGDLWYLKEPHKLIGDYEPDFISSTLIRNDYNKYSHLVTKSVNNTINSLGLYKSKL